MPKYWIFEVVSKSGKPVGLFGKPHESIAVYDKADLDRRVALAKHDRDLQVTVRPVR